MIPDDSWHVSTLFASFPSRFREFEATVGSKPKLAPPRWRHSHGKSSRNMSGFLVVSINEGTPIAGWLMENPMIPMDDLGVPLFQETLKWAMFIDIQASTIDTIDDEGHSWKLAMVAVWYWCFPNPNTFTETTLRMSWGFRNLLRIKIDPRGFAKYDTPLVSGALVSGAQLEDWQCFSAVSRNCTTVQLAVQSETTNSK